MPYFDDSLTLDEAKQLYRRLARAHHPDIAGDSGETFKQLGLEYEAFKLRKERPVLGVAAPAPNADPMAWFAAMKAAAQTAASATPEQLRHSVAQARAHAASEPPAVATWTPTPEPPPYTYTYSPPPPPPAPPPAASAAPAGAAAATATATPPRVRRARTTMPSPTPAQPRRTTAQKEEADYQEARYASLDKYHTRRHGDAVIFWENTTWDRLECVAFLTPSNPRHEIRRNGLVVHSEPATRKWQAERKDVIERAKRMI
jgi:hypothetical protein